MIKHDFPKNSFIGGWYIPEQVCDNLIKEFKLNREKVKHVTDERLDSGGDVAIYPGCVMTKGRVGKSNDIKTTQDIAKRDPKATKRTQKKPSDPVRPDGIEGIVKGLQKGLKNKKVNKRRNNIFNRSRKPGDLNVVTGIPGFGLDR